MFKIHLSLSRKYLTPTLDPCANKHTVSCRWIHWSKKYFSYKSQIAVVLRWRVMDMKITFPTQILRAKDATRARHWTEHTGSEGEIEINLNFKFSLLAQHAVVWWKFLTIRLENLSVVCENEKWNQNNQFVSYFLVLFACATVGEGWSLGERESSISFQQQQKKSNVSPYQAVDVVSTRIFCGVDGVSSCSLKALSASTSWNFNEVLLLKANLNTPESTARKFIYVRNFKIILKKQERSVGGEKIAWFVSRAN